MSPVDGGGRGRGLKLTFTNKSSLVNIVTTAGEDTEVPRGLARPIRGRCVAPVTNQRRPVTTASANFLFLVTSEAGPGHCFPVTEAASEPGLAVRSRARAPGLMSRTGSGPGHQLRYVATAGSMGGS